MDHEQENDERFVRGTWAPPSEAASTSTGDPGVARVPAGDRDARDLRVGPGSWDPASFRPNPDCSCWRCAVERLCKELEHVEALGADIPAACPRWDTDLPAQVEALNREIFSEQELDKLRREIFSEQLRRPV